MDEETIEALRRANQAVNHGRKFAMIQFKPHDDTAQFFWSLRYQRMLTDPCPLTAVVAQAMDEALLQAFRAVVGR